ncbi:amidase [Pseudodonghicola xiamenensis]|uniref:Indoleacetamide hydrolase n=1 Tax=Pseudodonghicola xiamenensis TaxID=337702 RepID=A0A8J3H697_9RHOB|nr:amidase [Pseudodonghicola xiamenensis]GHG84750.1 indoleacetamide hydrolase [Pseudodonghicola xiamenensis]
MSSELWAWTASELADAISAGRISSVEATESALARMEAVNGPINAVVDPLPEQAMEAARAADAELKTSGPRGPLHGVPITVKINVDYKGRATTNGVVAYKDLIAPEDGSVVRNLRASGAVIIGRTNTPCYSMRGCTSNDLHGHTYNPHDKTLTPGGSSGGAGSATAAGIGAMGHGNDIGGSVRYPAYCCGIYGLRPTAGITAAYNPSQLAERPIVSQMSSVQGPLARSVEDIRITMQALAQPDPRDIWQVPLSTMFDAPLEHRPCKVAMLAETDESQVDPEVTAAIRQAGAILAEAGYQVEEVQTPSFHEAMMFWRLILGNEMRGGLYQLMLKNGDEKLKKSMALMLEGIPEIEGREEFLQAFAKRSTLLRQWQMFFVDYPIVLTAMTWIKPYLDDLDVIDGTDSDWFFRAHGPMMGTPTLGLPGLSVPVGTVPGVPMGVQLISDRYGDRRLLEAGAVLERAIGATLPIDPRG